MRRQKESLASGESTAYPSGTLRIQDSLYGNIWKLQNPPCSHWQETQFHHQGEANILSHFIFF